MTIKFRVRTKIAEVIKMMMMTMMMTIIVIVIVMMRIHLKVA